MKKILFIILGSLLLLVVCWFYWFQWRPAEIRKECHWESINSVSDFPNDEPSTRTEKQKLWIDTAFNLCLRRNGLN